MPKKKKDLRDVPPGGNPEDDQTGKIGLKPQREEENEAKKETRWKKVSAVFGEAEKAYMAGSGFDEVVATLVETLKNLAKSEVPQGLGGLGVNDGPEMDLPAEELENRESEDEPIPEEKQ